MKTFSAQRRGWKYALAALLVIGAQALTLAIPQMVNLHSLALFIAAVALAIYFGGLGAGLLAVVLSLLSADWFMLSPKRSFGMANPDDLVRIALFLMVAVVIGSLHAARSRAMLSLQKSDQRLKLALETACMGVWDYNVITGAFASSRSLEQIIGREPGRFSPTYEAFCGCIHPDDRNFFSQTMARTIEEGMDYEIEHRVVRDDQAVRWISTRGRILYNAAGKPERIIGVAIDITDRREKRPDAPSADLHPPASEPERGQVVRASEPEA
jgi:PAS domain S-box-containing protein